MRNALPISVLALATLASAQEPNEPNRQPLPGKGTIISEAHGLGVYDDQMIGGGDDYHAVFDKGGLEFTPAFGKKAKRLFPVRMTLESIRRGGVVVHEAQQNAQPRQNGNFANYDRAGITERYEIRADGVEQSFVFPQRPRGNGDLVVRLRIQTDLQAAKGQKLHSMKFDNPSLGGVSVGAITGIGARGMKSGGWMNFDGTHLELVLPGDFVARASYPMVLDPIIGSYLCLQCIANNDRDPEVAYDASYNTYLVVWERYFSSTNIAIRGQRVSGSTGARIGSWIAITPQLRECYNPSVANVNVRNRFCVVWQQYSGSWNVMGRSVSAANGSMAAEFGIATTSAGEANPDVCGEATTADDEVCCVYTSGSSVMWAEATVRADGTGVVVRRRTLGTGSQPSICKSGGAARRVFAAWRVNTKYIAAQAFSMNSTPLSAVGLVSGKNPHDPEVDGDGTNFMLVYAVEEARSTRGDIWCINPIIPPTSTGLWRFNRKAAVTNQVNDNEQHPVVADLGNKWLVAYQDDYGSLRTTITLAVLDRTCNLCGRQFEGGTVKTGYYTTLPGVASKRSGGLTSSNECLLVFGERQGANNHIKGYRFAGSVGGPTRTIASGCAGGGTAYTSGRFSFGEPFSWRLTGADTSARVGVLVIGFPGTRTIWRCGSCNIMLGPVKLFTGVSGGRATVNYRLRCDPRYYGLDVDAQWWTSTTRSRPCTILPGFGASNIIRNRVLD